MSRSHECERDTQECVRHMAAESRLKAGCSQDWLPHKAAPQSARVYASFAGSFIEHGGFGEPRRAVVGFGLLFDFDFRNQNRRRDRRDGDAAGFGSAVSVEYLRLIAGG